MTDAIFLMIAVDFQPFSLVEDTGFLQVLHIADPAYEIPSRSHFSKTLLPMKYAEMREKEILLKSAQAISLTTDAWPSLITLFPRLGSRFQFCWAAFTLSIAIQQKTCVTLF